ncbi:uncharacterized protein [Palaemon carinicauda]|uniref:uncharacterized protein n=1 Tax=Palaemon carinicauda TaxID=392227 RepID=UPI0035B57CDC
MKFLIAAVLGIAGVYGQTRIPAQPRVISLPADVLRDFPDTCFAATPCRVIQVGESWPLSPSCGRATCLQEGQTLTEKVEDCGPRPKDSPGCKITNEADLQKPFPACCPVYECQEGATLLYPSEEEIAAASQEAAARAAAAAKAAQDSVL